MTAAYLPAGSIRRSSIVFNQSQVAEHAELAWIFNCVARIGWLNRMTQFKEKAGKDREEASVGLYVYPNLMAADILSTTPPMCRSARTRSSISNWRATSPEVQQRLSPTSIAAHGFDGDLLPAARALITGPATRVMSLRDGTKKMSKSDPSDLSRINLTDDADTIAQKIRKAKTDPEPLPTEAAGLKGRPEADNLVGIYAALAGEPLEKVLAQFGGGQFSTFKNALADLAVAKLGPIGAETKRLQADPAFVDAVLADGSARARAIAAPIVRKAREIVGFVVS